MDNDRLALRLIIELRVADTATLVGRITNDPKRAHRTDNDPSTILRRIDIYERNNKPLLEYYRRMRVPVQEIDASQPIGMVQQAMNAVVSKVLARYASRTSSLNLA
jgi:adenylate kinase family enzyme